MQPDMSHAAQLQKLREDSGIDSFAAHKHGQNDYTNASALPKEPSPRRASKKKKKKTTDADNDLLDLDALIELKKNKTMKQGRGTITVPKRHKHRMQIDFSGALPDPH